LFAPVAEFPLCIDRHRLYRNALDGDRMTAAMAMERVGEPLREPLAGARVAIVVLGDLGRSPRMLHHAAACLDSGAAVDLIGYAGVALPDELSTRPGLTVHALSGPRLARRHALPRAAFLAYSAVRVAAVSLRLSTLLRRLPRPDLLLVQNPPALPTLAVAAWAARARRVPLVIDWHNFAYTQLGPTLGKSSRLLEPARRLERSLASAAAHLCVSAAMREALAKDWGITAATVLRDRPACFIAPSQRAAARARLAAQLDLPLDGPDAPAVVISPTSWSADEDSDLLLDALGRLEAGADGSAPRVLCVLTGDGPRRAGFEAAVKRRKWERVMARTLWLEPNDYPALLAGADLGLCLHRSTSGVDLPMKIADLHGAGVPVCALDYGPCLREMLTEEEAKLGFTHAAGLVTRLRQILNGFPLSPGLDVLRAAVGALPRTSWADGWRAEALPRLAAVMGRAVDEALYPASRGSAD
jgi:beta-1,4-mannosyltransferase